MIAFTLIVCIGLVGSLVIIRKREVNTPSVSSISSVLSLTLSSMLWLGAMLIASIIPSTASEDDSIERTSRGDAHVLVTATTSSKIILAQFISPNLMIFFEISACGAEISSTMLKLSVMIASLPSV